MNLFCDVTVFIFFHQTEWTIQECERLECYDVVYFPFVFSWIEDSKDDDP